MSQESDFAALDQATQCWDSGGVAITREDINALAARLREQYSRPSFVVVDPFMHAFTMLYFDCEKAAAFRAGYEARLGRPITKRLRKRCEKAWSEYCRKHAQAVTMFRGNGDQDG